MHEYLGSEPNVAPPLWKEIDLLAQGNTVWDIVSVDKTFSKGLECNASMGTAGKKNNPTILVSYCSYHESPQLVAYNQINILQP